MTEITLPLPPNRGNARGHWAVHHNAKKRYVQSCLWAVCKALGPLAPGRRSTYEQITVNATFYVWSKSDVDNLVARLKWPLDALVTYHVVPDDTPEHVQLGKITQTVDRKNQRLVLKIETVR